MKNNYNHLLEYINPFNFFKKNLFKLNIILVLLTSNASFSQDFSDAWHLQIPSANSLYYGYADYEHAQIVGDTLYLLAEYYGDSIDIDPGIFINLIDDDDNNHLSGMVFVAKYNINTGAFLGGSKLLEIPSHLNGGNTVMNIYDYAVAPNGKLIVIGSCVNGVDFDGGPGSAGLFSSATAVSFVSFYEGNGAYLGHIEYDLNYTGTPFSSSYNNTFEPISVSVDNSNNIYLSGYLLGTVDLDFTAGVDSKTSLGNYDAAFIKIDGISESYDWGFSFGGSSSEFILGSVISNNDLVLIGSYASANVDLNVGSGTFNVTNPMTCCDWTFFSRINAAGNFVNGGSIGGDTEFNLKKVEADQNGNIYMLGGLDNSMPFDIDPTNNNHTPYYDQFLVNYNPDFSIASVASYFYYNELENFSVAPNYIALMSYVDPGQQIIIHSSNTNEHDTISAGIDGGMFVAPMTKTTSSLGSVAYYPFIYDRYAYPSCSTTDINGNFYFSGTFYDAIDLNPFDGIDTPDTATFASNDINEVFVAKLNWDGFVSVEENVMKHAVISVFPNPASAILNIVSDENISSVQLFDLSGKLIQQVFDVNSANHQFNLSTQLPGIYLITITLTSGEVETVKIAIK